MVPVRGGSGCLSGDAGPADQKIAAREGTVRQFLRNTQAQ